MLKKLTLLTVFAGLMVSGCKDFDCCMSGALSADVADLTFDGAGGIENFNITSSMNWELLETGDIPVWLTVNPWEFVGVGSRNITVTATSNPGGERYYTLVFKAANGEKLRIEITQEEIVYTVPDAPTIGVATAGDGEATVTFTAPVNDGNSAISTYTVTSNPGGITVIDASSPITVTGLTNGTAYTFTVTATNSVGESAPSAASNSVTPATLILSTQITVIAPATGGTPDLTATTAAVEYTCGAVTWSPSDNPFDSSTEYTATVTLTAATGYVFDALVVGTINGETATFSNNTGATVDVSYTFRTEIDAKYYLTNDVWYDYSDLTTSSSSTLTLSGTAITTSPSIFDYPSAYTKDETTESPETILVGGLISVTITVTWAYLYDDDTVDTLIGVACYVEIDIPSMSLNMNGNGIILGKTACDGLKTAFMIGTVDTNGMQDNDNGISADANLVMALTMLGIL